MTADRNVFSENLPNGIRLLGSRPAYEGDTISSADTGLRTTSF